MLDMRQVTKVYRTELVETHALRSLDLSVQEGEFVAVVGFSEHLEFPAGFDHIPKAFSENRVVVGNDDRGSVQ